MTPAQLRKIVARAKKAAATRKRQKVARALSNIIVEKIRKPGQESPGLGDR